MTCPRWSRRVTSTALSTFVALAAVSGCAAARNNPMQDYVWSRWDYCKSTPELATSSTVIDRVERDGRYWSNSTYGHFQDEWPRIQACMKQQFLAHPYLD